MLDSVHHAGDRATAVLPDALDLHTTPAVRAVLDRIVDEGCRHLTLDASRTTCLDSTGITVLIHCYQRLSSLNGTLSMTELGEHPHALLIRLGLHTVITLTPLPHGTPQP
ncbi:STAS domain-containing protein [Streptomyces sp. NPDC001941]|uniref:STAS domain-containing protein n=1 Tax=Streptomyces sp. NPDC001941 TaxID=3154659 RepID=UPI0033194AEF